MRHWVSRFVWAAICLVGLASAGAASQPPRGADGRAILGDSAEERAIARGEAALRELGDLERSGAEASGEERAWGYHILSTSLMLGNEADGRMVARFLTDADADPYIRAAAANVVLFTLFNIYPPEPEDPEEVGTLQERREFLAPFWKPVSTSTDRLLEAARQADPAAVDADAKQRVRLVRMAALLAAVEGGDDAALRQAIEVADEDAEHYGRVIQVAAMREPPLLKRDDAEALSPILQRLEQLLAAKQEREDVVEAIAALGEAAGTLADDIVRTHPEPKGDFDLDLESSKAMELIGPAATEHLLPLLKHKEARIRAMAVLALGAVYSEFPLYLSEPREPPAEVVRAIKEMEEDPDAHVQEAAMRVAW